MGERTELEQVKWWWWLVVDQSKKDFEDDSLYKPGSSAIRQMGGRSAAVDAFR